MAWTFGIPRVANRRRATRSRERLLAISITPNEVVVLDATRSRMSLQIHQSARWAAPVPLTPEWLRSQLDAICVSTRNVLLVVPRQAAMLKLLDVPEVADDELASLVMLQAESRLSQPLHELCCDFVKLPGAPHALLASVPRTVIDTQTKILNAVGLNVIAATIGELNFIQHDPKELVSGLQVGLFIDSHGSQAELVLSCLGTPVSTMTVRVSGNSDANDQRLIASSMTRLLASLPSSLANSRIGSVALFGARAVELVPNTASIGLPDALAIHASVVDEAVGFALEPLLAMSLLSRASCDRSLDLLNPRRPSDPQAAGRRRLWRIATAAAALVGIGVFAALEHSQALTAEIRQLKQRDAELAKLIERGQSILGAASFVSDWQQGQVHWPRTVAAFAEQLPSRDRAYLTRLTLEVSPSSATPTIRASGLARNTSDVLQLHQRLLAEEAGYELQPHSIEPNAQDAFFQAKFEIEAAIKPTNEN